jgi:hypothetical protein
MRGERAWDQVAGYSVCALCIWREEQNRSERRRDRGNKRVSRSAQGETVSAEVPPGRKTTFGARLQDARMPGVRVVDRWADGSEGGKDTRAVRSARLSVQGAWTLQTTSDQSPTETHPSMEHGPQCLVGSVCSDTIQCVCGVLSVSNHHQRMGSSVRPPPPRDRRMGVTEPSRTIPTPAPESAHRSGMISCAELQCLGSAACVAHLCPSWKCWVALGVSQSMQLQRDQVTVQVANSVRPDRGEMVCTHTSAQPCAV